MTSTAPVRSAATRVDGSAIVFSVSFAVFGLPPQ